MSENTENTQPNSSVMPEGTPEGGMDEKSSIIAQLKLMGRKLPHHKSGIEKYREALRAAHEGTKEEPEVDEKGLSPKELLAKQRNDIYRHATEKLRVIVRVNNPLKSNWQGEIVTASNSAVTTQREYVPFGNKNGWHLTRIILNTLEDRMYRVKGNGPEGSRNAQEGGMSKEFSIEYLEPLTVAELEELRSQQNMRNAALGSK